MEEQHETKLINGLNNEPTDYHVPVLLHEVIEGLHIKPVWRMPT